MTSVNVILSHVHPTPIFINFSRKIHINVTDSVASWSSAWILLKNFSIKIVYIFFTPLS